MKFGIVDMWNKLKKGVKAGIMAMNDVNVIDSNTLARLQSFLNSDSRLWMLIGERYYEVEHDICNKIIDNEYRANNKLAHGLCKELVDEKVNYILSKDVTYKTEDGVYVDKIKNVLGKHFQYQLSGLGYEASNKGIAWLHVYLDKLGKFKTLIIPAEQCLAIWKDNSHTELEKMIRIYDIETWVNSSKKIITNVEIWEEEGVSYYKYENSSLVPYYDLNQDNNGPIAHYKNNDEWSSWGKVPFVAFKNNRIEAPDIKFIKSLVDNYDTSRSEVADFVEEVKNLIFVLKGYGGEDIDEFMEKLKKNRAIPIDDPTEGGVDTINPNMDISAIKGHFEQLKRDIIEFGQGVNKDLDKFGSAPSGIALSFLYSSLDLKANAIETEFKMAFENLLYFVDVYLSQSNQGDYSTTELDIIFNRDMKINQSEVITNCQNSKGIISDDTILANHPWVKDIEREKEALKEQMETNMPFQDKVPLSQINE